MLVALAGLEAPPPVLHLYARPGEPGDLAAQHTFAAGHHWHSVVKFDGRSHFPMVEVPLVAPQHGMRVRRCPGEFAAGLGRRPNRSFV